MIIKQLDRAKSTTKQNRELLDKVRWCRIETASTTSTLDALSLDDVIAHVENYTNVKSL